MSKSLRILLASFWAIVLPSAVIWTHHLLVTGLNPFLGVVFVLLSTVIAVLFAILAIRRLINRHSENKAFTPTMLFEVTMISWLVSGVFMAVFFKKSTLDLQLYDTYFVLSYSLAMAVLAVVFGIFRFIYYAYPRFLGRSLNKFLSYIHFWITFVSAYILFWPRAFAYEGMAGMPRRYFDYSNWSMPFGLYYFGRGPYAELTALCGLVALLVAQLLFVLNFISSLRKKKIAPPNS